MKESHHFQSQPRHVVLVFLSLFTTICVMGSGVIMVSGDTTIANCEYPCQPTPPLPPPPPSRPLYGTPPPPPPPPREPVYEAPPPSPPSEPVYAAPPPPPSPTGPLYAVPPPPSPPMNCQPPMQNCVYTPPNTDVYQHIDSASDVPLYWLHILALLSLFFLPWLLC